LIDWMWPTPPPRVGAPSAPVAVSTNPVSNCYTTDYITKHMI